MGGGEQVQVEGGTVYQPRVADPMPLAAPSVAPLQLQLPKTQIALDYLGVLNNQTMSPQLLGQQMNSGIVMPHIIGLNYAS